MQMIEEIAEIKAEIKRQRNREEKKQQLLIFWFMLYIFNISTPLNTIIFYLIMNIIGMIIDKFDVITLEKSFSVLFWCLILHMFDVSPSYIYVFFILEIYFL
jgi:hypothetical protein